MTEDDPRPLKTSGETPAELASALRAMSRDRDAARLARVAERLAASIAATPPQSWVTRLSRTQIGFAGFALVAGVLGYVLFLERGTPTAGKSAAPSVGSQPQPQPQEPAPALPIEPIEPSPPTAAAPRRQPPRVSRPAPRSRAPAPSAEGRAAEGHAAEGRAANASGSATAVEPAPVSDPAAPAQPKPEPNPKRKPAAVAAVPQPSEVALLQQARSAASQQPTAALRLLQQHAERFPDGLLTPEREVLAIEVLRTLGRTEEAAQRLQRFEARYPKSIHLGRLQRGAAKDF